ncbi:MAG: hypothetical protein OSJ54_13730 [Oscillospiraceae bacterium]|nr:hypothetical protein [Oscillospiraceae bacterium]
MKSAETKTEKIRCPYCGYIMPIKRDKDAVCKGLRVQCKARNCKKEFEIKINSEIK